MADAERQGRSSRVSRKTLFVIGPLRWTSEKKGL
jgi:hypothetical protein